MAYRGASKIHLDEALFRTAFTAAIPLNDGRFKRDALETRHMECDISGGRNKVPVVVAAAVALAGLIALVAGSLGQLLCC